MGGGPAEPAGMPRVAEEIGIRDLLTPSQGCFADADNIVNNIVIHGACALIGGSLRAGHRAN